MKEKRYYLFKDPYMALIVAYDLEGAKKEYVNTVADINYGCEVEEISKALAVVKLSKSLDEDGEVTGLATAKKQLDEMSDFLDIASVNRFGITLFVEGSLV